MAEALNAEPAVLEKMGRAGMQRVIEQHDFQKSARKFIQLFESTPGSAAASNGRQLPTRAHLHEDGRAVSAGTAS
jgi:hypothetical protein